MATPASPVLPVAAPNAPAHDVAPAAARDVAPAAAHDVAPTVEMPAKEAPAAIVATSTLEASPCAPSTPSEWHDAGHDTLAPNNVDLPPGLSRRTLRMPRHRTLVAAAMVALAGVIGLVASSTKSERDTVVALPPAAAPAKPAPAPAAPPPTQATAAPATSSQSTGLVESAKAALLGTDDTVLVTVHVSPPNAVVFNRGLRFGTGTVTIKVPRGTKTTLFARLDGYVPRTIVLDGKNDSVNIELYRLQSSRVTVARPAPKRATASPESEPDNATPANADQPSEGVSNGASDPEPNKQSPSQPASTGKLDPIDGLGSP